MFRQGEISVWSLCTHTRTHTHTHLYVYAWTHIQIYSYIFMGLDKHTSTYTQAHSEWEILQISSREQIFLLWWIPLTCLHMHMYEAALSFGKAFFTISPSWEGQPKEGSINTCACRGISGVWKGLVCTGSPWRHLCHPSPCLSHLDV